MEKSSRDTPKKREVSHMDKLRNQAFPSQRSLEFFHKNSQEKFQMKTDCVKKNKLTKCVKRVQT